MNELIEKIREGGVLSGFLLGSLVAFTLTSVHCDSQVIEDDLSTGKYIELDDDDLIGSYEDNIDKKIKNNTHIIEQILKKQGLQWNYNMNELEPYDDNNELIQLIECKK